MTAVLVHTASREATAALGMARVSAAGRIRAARLRRQAQVNRAWEIARETGQLLLEDEVWCFVCGRATDHTGEHTPEQLAETRRFLSL